MAGVTERVRQVVIDVDADGSYQGGTLMMQREFTDENGNVEIIGMRTAPATPEELTQALGESAAKHILRVEELENQIEFERKQHQQDNEAYSAQLLEARRQREEALAKAEEFAGKLEALSRVLNPPQ